MESYTTVRPGVEVTGTSEDRRSRFIAHLLHIERESEAASHLASVRSRHFDARHHVPAWILADGRERASDDGEPQRTGGLPTLEVLRGAGLRDVSCVTVRYFGGTLLGPGGLVRAYASAAQAALESARASGGLVEMTSVVPVDVRLAYADYDRVTDLASRAGGKVADAAFAADISVRLVFRAGEEAPFLAALREVLAGREDARAGEARFAEF